MRLFSTSLSAQWHSHGHFRSDVGHFRSERGSFRIGKGVISNGKGGDLWSERGSFWSELEVVCGRFRENHFCSKGGFITFCREKGLNYSKCSSLVKKANSSRKEVFASRKWVISCQKEVIFGQRGSFLVGKESFIWSQGSLSIWYSVFLPTVWYPDHLKILVDREKWSCKKENENKGKMRNIRGKNLVFFMNVFQTQLWGSAHLLSRQKHSCSCQKWPCNSHLYP